jgi:hypothetical protein
MGYNTALLILNDAADGLRTGGEVAHNIYSAMFHSRREGERATDFGIGSYPSGGSVLPSQHADHVQIVAVGGNYIKPVTTIWNGWRDMADDTKLLKAMADSMGYRLVKKPAR